MKKLTLSILLVMSHAVFATEGTLIVHEWGTFTSVQGSNGQALGGMNHEEEQLPSFVGGRDVLQEPFKCRFSKSVPICDDEVLGPVIHAAQVTQKMETPVIYFHSDRERHVKAMVSFPQGIISQYFPNPAQFYPAIGSASRLANGFTRFEVDLKMASLTVPAVAPTSVYAPARKVDANFLSSGSENEKFIFYRGLGNFQTEVNVTSAASALSVNNNGNNYVPAAFLIDVGADGSGSVRKLNALIGHGKITVSADELKNLHASHLSQGMFLAQAAFNMNTALQATGLYKDEAEAMTNTWKNSYFRNPGLRVLYILSRAETDALLPLTLEPQPQELQRALVGRIEVIMDTEEASLLANLQNDLLSVSSLGRFAEPKLRRLQQLTQDQSLIDKLNAMIAKIQ